MRGPGTLLPPELSHGLFPISYDIQRVSVSFFVLIFPATSELSHSYFSHGGRSLWSLQRASELPEAHLR